MPIHAELVACGFLDYVEQQRQAGSEKLFPSLSNKNKNRVWSNALGKWFGRYLDSIGLDDPRLDYHSFRYTFKQACSLCGIDNEARDALAGHWEGGNSASKVYLRNAHRQYPFPKLVAAMDMLGYSDVSLQHIYLAPIDDRSVAPKA